MTRFARITIFAVVLLAVLFSLPFWLPNTLAAVSKPSENGAPAAELAQTDSELQVNAEVPGLVGVETSPLLAQASEPIFLWDGGRFIGPTTLTVDAPPQVLAWIPSAGQPLWTRETGFSYGGLYDAAENRIILIEQRNAKSQSLEGISIPDSGIYPSAEWPLFLTVLDASTGELISVSEVSGRFFNSATSGAAIPLALRGSTLYLMNYGVINNLAAYDLTTGVLSEEKWDLCETGYPTQVSVSAELNSAVSLCVDYSTSDMKGSVTQLSLADGSTRSLDLGQLGNESYMGGNGLVLSNSMAYALDNYGGVIVEIDLSTMQIVRQVNYLEGLAADMPNLSERFVSWMLRQAATPAAAKRMFAVTAVSPDGSTLAVTGGMLDTYDTRTVHLIDLETLQATQALQTGSTPAALVFQGNDLLLAFYERSNYSNPLGGMVFDLKNSEQDNITLDINGYLSEVLVAD